jgi:hypothetical protein
MEYLIKIESLVVIGGRTDDLYSVIIK